MTDPKFVRLSQAQSRGILADVSGSGWSISGRDVRPLPDSLDSLRFVRKHLRSGRLEAASLAEYEEAHPAEDAPSDVGHQEHIVREEAASASSEPAPSVAETSEVSTEEPKPAKKRATRKPKQQPAE